MAAGSKEKELEDTLPGAEEIAASAEASELRRRLLQVASNDSAERQRAGTLPPPAGEQPQSGARALRSTLQFVRRRPAGNEEVTVTAVSGAPLSPREEPSSGGRSDGDEAEPRPSRARIVVPLVAGALLVLVALIHRTLSNNESAQGSVAVVFEGGRVGAAAVASGRLGAAPRRERLGRSRWQRELSGSVCGGGAFSGSAFSSGAFSRGVEPARGFASLTQRRGGAPARHGTEQGSAKQS